MVVCGNDGTPGVRVNNDDGEERQQGEVIKAHAIWTLASKKKLKERKNCGGDDDTVK